MMRSRWLILLLITFPDFALAQAIEADGRPNVETLTYRAGFRVLSVGETTMTREYQTDSTGIERLYISATTKTDPIVSSLYVMDDLIQLWLDPTTAAMGRMERILNEGSYHLRDTSWVDETTDLLYFRRDTVALSEPLFDPIGAIYHFRYRDLAVGDTIRINVFDGKHIRPFAVRVSGPVTKKVPAGKFECLALLPTSLDGKKLTKSGDMLRIWLTNDARRLPVQIEQRINYGMLVLRLSEIGQN